jgi:hypothetical protein
VILLVAWLVVVVLAIGFCAAAARADRRARRLLEPLDPCPSDVQRTPWLAARQGRSPGPPAGGRIPLPHR